MKPLITIGISFKNPGEYFRLALQSIFSQTFTCWELILVDDGSTDDSLSLAKCIEDERLHIYSDGQSKGLNVRLNQMIQLANALYFFRMDADDIMHPQRLEKQYKILTQHDENTVIGTAAYSIDINSNVVGFRPSQQNQQFCFDARHSFWHPTVAASTAWFRTNPYTEEFMYKRSEDAELWCRTTSQTKFINLAEPLLYYRENGTFSFNNYLETSFGLLYLIHNNFTQPRSKYIYLFSRELIKLWINFIFNLFSISNYLVARRYKLLSLLEIETANVALAIVQQQQLPLK
jgi:glycosyltransferase involved in cell wall biosynthesis